MSQYKTLLSLCLIAFSALKVSAESVERLHYCQSSLNEASVGKPSHGFGDLKDQAFILEKSATKNSFLVFNNRGIYRCNLPKENALVAIFTSCRKNEADSETYNLEIKLPNQKSQALSYSRQKDSPYKTRSLGHHSFSDDAGPRDDKWCAVTCRESLSPENRKLVEDQVTESISEVHDSVAKRLQALNKDAKYGCDSMSEGISRTLKAVVGKSTTEADCIKAEKEKAKLISLNAKRKTISALNACRFEANIRPLAEEQMAMVDDSKVPSNDVPGVSSQNVKEAIEVSR